MSLILLQLLQGVFEINHWFILWNSIYFWVINALKTAKYSAQESFYDIFIYVLFIEPEETLRLKISFADVSWPKWQQYISFITRYYNTNRLKTLKQLYVVESISICRINVLQWSKDSKFSNFSFDCRRLQSVGAAYIKAFLPHSDRTKGTERI